MPITSCVAARPPADSVGSGGRGKIHVQYRERIAITRLPRSLGGAGWPMLPASNASRGRIMWSFRRTTRRNAVQSPVRLRLEALDLRLPPSSLFDLPLADDPALTPLASDAGTSGQIAAPLEADPPAAPGAPPPGPTAPPEEAGAPPPLGQEEQSERDFFVPPPANANPQVTNFQGVEVVGGLWRFTGDVTDEAPGGLTITFGGEPDSLQTKTATTDANGHFDVAFLMNTDGSDDGLASAQTVDGGGLASNVALYNVHPS